MLSKEGFASGQNRGVQQEWLLGWGTQECHHGAGLCFGLHQGLGCALVFSVIHVCCYSLGRGGCSG